MCVCINCWIQICFLNLFETINNGHSRNVLFFFVVGRKMTSFRKNSTVWYHRLMHVYSMENEPFVSWHRPVQLLIYIHIAEWIGTQLQCIFDVACVRALSFSFSSIYVHSLIHPSIHSFDQSLKYIHIFILVSSHMFFFLHHLPRFLFSCTPSLNLYFSSLHSYSIFIIPFEILNIRFIPSNSSARWARVISRWTEVSWLLLLRESPQRRCTHIHITIAQFVCVHVITIIIMIFAH